MKNWLKKKFGGKSAEENSSIKETVDTAPYLNRLNIIEKENLRRLDHLKSKLQGRKKEVFELIPLILHENHPDLPGNEWSSNIPAGLACYDPPLDIAQSLKRHFPKAEIEKRAKQSRPIQFLCIMGSAGSASFTSESDIDFWVGIDKKLITDENLSWLQSKLTAIEKWALKTAELPVHFFITDPEELRNEDYGEAKGESCGTALGKLLKDEFYRTALFICGKRPWYWLAKPGDGDAAYQAMIENLKAESTFRSFDFIDLGHVHTLDGEEFAGAALWHLSKALHSPFKSLLKLGHVDNLSVELAKKPLCEIVKEALLAGKSGIDPYFLFADEVRKGYALRGMQREERLMETAYLIKSLSSKAATDTERTDLIKSITNTASEWGITEKEIEKIAGFREWDYETTENLRKRVVQYLIGTYGRIQKKASGTTGKISTRDTLVLGRKFRSFFETKPDKIPFEFLMHTLSDIEAVRISEQNGEWQIYTRIRGSHITEMSLLRKCNSSASAIGFSFLNSLPFAAESVAFKGHIRFNKSEALHLYSEMGQFFGQLSVENEESENFMAASAIKSAFLVPNWEQPDWNHGIASLTVYLWSSHGEFFLQNYRGGEWKRWLFGEIFQNIIGKANVNKCRISVFKPDDRLGLRQKVSADLEAEIATFRSTMS
ncbi:MAG: class I adenylate cyclase [Fibrobacteres bacterium]|nr:class I adenylate cyclase [Fibrobacterota bacterium]